MTPPPHPPSHLTPSPGPLSSCTHTCTYTHGPSFGNWGSGRVSQSAIISGEASAASSALMKWYQPNFGSLELIITLQHTYTHAYTHTGIKQMRFVSCCTQKWNLSNWTFAWSPPGKNYRNCKLLNPNLLYSFMVFLLFCFFCSACRPTCLN